MNEREFEEIFVDSSFDITTDLYYPFKGVEDYLTTCETKEEMPFTVATNSINELPLDLFYFL